MRSADMHLHAQMAAYKAQPIANKNAGCPLTAAICLFAFIKYLDSTSKQTRRMF